MSKEQVRRECVYEILSGLGYELSYGECDVVVEGIMGHLDSEFEMEHNSHTYTDKESPDCIKLKATIKRLETELYTYKQSIMKAYNASDCIVKDGKVFIEKEY